MASQTVFEVGEVVKVRNGPEYLTAIVLDVQAPLGFRTYSLMDLHDGQKFTTTRVYMEKTDTRVKDELLGDFGPIADNPQPQPAAKPKPAAKSKPQSRFIKMSEKELDEMQNASKSAKTHSQTRWGVNIFKEWLVANDLPLDFENLLPEVLADYLRRFYGEVRQKGGKKYCQASLFSIRAAIFRHLTQPPNNVPFNILTDTIFIKANNLLVGNCRKMKEAGEDNSEPHPPIDPSDMKKMYDSRVLSHDSPLALQRKAFFEMVLHFGRRGREGLRKLKKEHIVFMYDARGREFATLSNNPLEKNHQGFSSKEGEHTQIMYATGTENCPIATLKLYLSKLNEKCEALLQRPREDGCWEQASSWYTNSPLGVNTIGNIMSKISKTAELSQIYTNHSIRATTVTTLRDAGMQPSDIIAVTGHRSTESLAHYSRGPSATKRAMMSHSLSTAASSGIIPELMDMQALALPAASSSATSSTQALALPAASCSSALMPKSLPVAVDNITMPEMPMREASLPEHSDITMAVQSQSQSITDLSKAMFSNVSFNNSTITFNLYHK